MHGKPLSLMPRTAADGYSHPAQKPLLLYKLVRHPRHLLRSHLKCPTSNCRNQAITLTTEEEVVRIPVVSGQLEKTNNPSSPASLTGRWRVPRIQAGSAVCV